MAGNLLLPGNIVSMAAGCADRLVKAGDGDAALLYLYLLRRGGVFSAEGARKALGCDIALATTGVAGPDKDEWDNEVGTMFVAIATPDGTHVRPLKLGSRPVRARLRTQTAHHAFDLARRYLTGLPYEDGAV